MNYLLCLLTIYFLPIKGEQIHFLSITKSEIDQKFGDLNCIERGLLSLENVQSPFLEQLETQPVNVQEHLKLEQEIDDWLENKNSISLINELAQFNGIKATYTRLDGVPSNVFIMHLKLGEEEYESDGTNTKEAKHAVAEEALMFTKYKHPPIPDPTGELKKLAESYGDTIEYNQHSVEGNSYFANLVIGGMEFLGKGLSLQKARQHAALQALHELPILKSAQDKSPISVIHEWSVKHGIKFRLEVVSDSGPPHRKIFVAECQIQDIITEATGKSKKIAKRGAAEKMVPHLVSIIASPVSYRTKKNKKKKKSYQTTENSFSPIKNGMNIVKNIAKDPIGVITNQVLTSNRITNKILGNKPNTRNYVSKMAAIIENLNTTIPLIKIGDTLSKTMETVKNYLKTDTAKPELKVKNPDESKTDFSSSTSKDLIQISKLLDFKVEFLPLPKKDNEMFTSLLSLGMDPAYICRGNGKNQQEANDNAAMFGLDLIADKGLYDKMLVLENDLKTENANVNSNIDLEKPTS